MGMMPLLFYLFVLAMPLGTRLLLGSFIPGFHEYEAAFLYANDLLLALLLIGLIRYIRHIRPMRLILPFLKGVPAGRGIFLAFFLAFAFLSIFWAPSSGLAFYQFARLLLLVGFAFATAMLIKNGAVRIQTILGVIAILAVAQSLLAVAQFGAQSDLGLQVLGEPSFGWRPIAGGGPIGGARIFVEGAKVFRPAGTFPHANVLGAYLIVGLLALYYFWLRLPSTNNESAVNRVPSFPPALTRRGRRRRESIRFVNSVFIRYSLMSIALFIVLLGIFLTFSRATWLVAALVTLAVLAWAILRGFRQKTERFRQGIHLAALLFAICVLLFAGFGRLVFPRATQVISGADPSISGRIAYQNMGISLIAKRPWGVGLGNQVLYAVENNLYQARGMTKVWQWEPVHNLYLLIAGEIGITGLAVFLIFLAMLVGNVRRYHDDNNDDDQKGGLALVIVIVILSSLLILGLFDHFLWTLQQGRLLLWLAIGLVWGLTRRNTLYYNQTI